MTKPTILVIVGITGDLAKRKLLPAIAELALGGVIPDKFQVVGISRRPDVVLDDLTHDIENASYITEHTELFQMNLGEEAEYHRLSERLHQIEDEFGEPAQRLFYLSVPPQASQHIIELLGSSSATTAGESKLLLEKPFGMDLASATELINHIDKYFAPEQVYRIDHYLAKEMAQNLITFREENVLFKNTWNKDFIKSIEITATEQIGIEGRVEFYEQTGALRDIVQSHLLQLAALTLMETPQTDELSQVPARRLLALQQLRIDPSQPITSLVKRGQYEGYREEVGNLDSVVETFVSLALQSQDPRWEGVPITIRTGKAMKDKNTEITITYQSPAGTEVNQLKLHLQPNEGVELCLWAKQPGYDQDIEKRSLQFTYTANERLPEAYERVFLDAIKSDHSLFVTDEEILETWRILDPVQRAWSMSSHDVISYEPGTDITNL